MKMDSVFKVFISSPACHFSKAKVILPYFPLTFHRNLFSSALSNKANVQTFRCTEVYPSNKSPLLCQKVFSGFQVRGEDLSAQSYVLSHVRNSLKLRCAHCPTTTTNSSRLYHGKRLFTSFGNEDSTASVDSVALILQATEKVDVMAGSLLPSSVEDLIQRLHSLGFDPRLTENFLSGKLWLLQNPDETISICQLLVDHGMSPDLVCRIVHDIPHSYRNNLHTVHDTVNEVLLLLRNLGFSEKEIYSLVGKDSTLLFVDEYSIRAGLAKIKSCFPATETKKIVLLSPNVLSDDWPSTQEKFDYCIWTMGYDHSDIVKSTLFSHSLHHIQDRHLFLLRANVFKLVNKKLHPSLNPNPPLRSVVDSSDVQFVKLVEGLSVQDYFVFRKMREMERRKEAMELDEDWEEGDEEGSGF